MKNESNDIGITLFERDLEYQNQYFEAIIILFKNKKLNVVILPLINLIHQYLELLLKSFLVEHGLYQGITTKSLNINNHNLRTLIEDDYLLEKVSGNKEYESIYKHFKKYVLYFGTILGENTFLNSRYAVTIDTEECTIKNINIDKRKFRRNFKELIHYSSEMMKIYTKYYLNQVNILEEKAKKNFDREM